MKRIASALFTAAVVVALLAGCDILSPSVVGSGRMTTASYGFKDYSAIVAGQAFRIHVVPDTGYSLQVTCDDNVVSHLVVRQSDATVSLGLEDGFNYSGVTVSAEIHMPVLAGLDMSGASDALVDAGFSSNVAFDAAISGASNIDIRGLDCGAVTADLSGASTLTFVGTATSETVKVSGASTADLGSCLGTSGNVTVSGASKIYMDVGTGRLDYSVSGASTLYYYGAPDLRQHNLSGASQVIHLS